MTTPGTRAALYAVLAAITPLLVAYGVMSDDRAALWLALGKTVLDALALLIAWRHVPDAPDAPKRAQPD